MKTAFGQSMASAIAATLIWLPGPARAITPPPPPPSYAAYGPTEICGPNFSLAIKAGEAVHASGDIVRIIGQDNVLAIKFGGLGLGRYDLPALRAVDGQREWQIARFEPETPDADRTLSHARQALEAGDMRYAIVDNDAGMPDLIIGSTAFDGTQSDERLIARITFGAKIRRDDCVDLAAALNDRGYARTTGAADDWAALYPQHPETGPLFHCINGVGFALAAGERIRRPWKSLGLDGPLYVDRNGYGIKLEQRGGERVRPKEVGSDISHPMSWGRKTSVSFQPSRGIGPPYAAEGVREAGRWIIDIGDEGYWNTSLSISFGDGEAAASGFEFLEALELVSPEDPRCAR